MKAVHSIWNLLDGDGPLRGIKTDFGQSCMLFEVSQDTDDGTYPRLCDWMRDANALDENGSSHFINRLTRKKDKLTIPFYESPSLETQSGRLMPCWNLMSRLRW